MDLCDDVDTNLVRTIPRICATNKFDAQIHGNVRRCGAGFKASPPPLYFRISRRHHDCHLRLQDRAVQLTVFQLIINGNKFVTFNRTNRLITAVISDPLHSL